MSQNDMVEQLSDPYYTALQCADEMGARIGNEFDLLKLAQALRQAGVTKPDSIRDGIITLHERALHTAREFCDTLVMRLPGEVDVL